MILRRYVEQILNLYNYMDGLVITDTEGIVVYCATFRPDISDLREEEVIGKHIFEIYPELSQDTSSIMRVLKTGEPIFNEYQKMKNFKGNYVYAVNITFPIKDDMDNIIGAVDVSRYVGQEYERKHISLLVEEERHKEPYYTLDDIVTENEAMLRIKEKIQRIAKTDSSVLIYGDTGTGKELIAQAIHSSSDRHSAPFIAQNCAAIPATLLESILFGTEKGSYTGSETRMGLFEMAQGGTLFLDEVNSMELSIQAKILRAIEEKRIRRIGGSREIELDIRLISSVNEEPQEALSKGKIRTDLFFRLSAVQIFIPPLRDRRSDIGVLTKYFVRKFNSRMNKNVDGVTKEVEEIFDGYSWPGNVRELRNTIEGAFNIMTGKLIKPIDLPEYITKTNSISKFIESEKQLPLNEKVEEYEKRLIIEALRNTSSFVEAARYLKISKQSLNYKIEKYNLKGYSKNSIA